MDRWYYPDRVTKVYTLEGKSFENILDKVYKGSALTSQTLKETPYFDKISDLVLEPGTRYKYSRISSEDIKEILNRLDEKRINTIFDRTESLVDTKSELPLNGKNYRKIKAAQLDKTNALNLNFDIFIDPDKDIGIQLLRY